MKSKLKVKYSPDADAMVITVRSGKPDYGDEKAPGVIRCEREYPHALAVG